jgi:hypothetical protein
VVGSGLHADAIEGANIQAKLTGRAGFRVDLGLGDSDGFYFFDRVGMVIDDGFHRAMDPANAAIDAKGRIDVMKTFLIARDGFSGTFDRTEGATNAIVQNNVRHELSPRFTRRNLTATTASFNQKGL